jgi:hypothetical protein
MKANQDSQDRLDNYTFVKNKKKTKKTKNKQSMLSQGVFGELQATRVNTIFDMSFSHS